MTWSSPATNRLLLDAGFGGAYYGYGHREREGNLTRDLIRVTEQCTAGCAANGGIPGLVYRSQDWIDAWQGSYPWRASAWYVTGGHSLKIGYQGTLMTDDQTWFTNNQGLTYRLNNGVPNQLTMAISPYQRNSRAAYNAFFAQEQYTLRRLTLQGALRFDNAWSWFPAQQEGPTRFLPTAITFPETKGVDSYKDLTPRMGVAYDVFGNGKTAVKANLGKYLEGAGIQLNYANPNPTVRLPGSWLSPNRHADLDRRERQLHTRLRSPESEHAGSAQWRQRFLRRHLGCEVRPERLQQHVRSGCSSPGGVSARPTGTSASPCSSSFSLVLRWKSRIAGGGTTASP